MSSRALMLALVAAWGISGIARAQIWPGTPMPAEPENQVALRRLSLTDQGFVRAAAASLPAQVQLGLLAEDRGATPAVRALGRRVVHQQHRIDFDLSRLAEGERLALPAATPPSARPSYLQLQELSGGDFDRVFLDQQRRGLAGEVELFKTEAVSGTHPSLRAFAHQHLRELRQEAKSVATTNPQRE